ncbi:transglycosylase domain-containing protein [Cohnella caldifontis]|uniref:transglycosylase domain-containing protein n=1 Tax=Cohnella caldifontis TaxID=3027471 RepID=UPI0023ED3FB2|nr:PBP1A family penicillin-binding protein [Cohnella sp. YIM B05605]
MQERTPAGQPASASNRGKAGGGNKRPGKGPRKRGARRGWLWLLFVAVLGVICAVIAYLLVILNGERILSQNLNKLNLDQASVITDQNDKQVAKLYVSEGNRENAPINEIPKLVRDAFVATEDKRFYEHGGVDLFGIGRALVTDIIHRSAQEGASTITQQLAKNLFLNADKTLFRKGTEASIALALERHKSKDEILELYLNRIYYGKGQYGIKTAAKFYFNKDITSKDPKQQLEIWQIATLAGIPKAPNTYNPISNPEKSKERRAVVLNLMRDQGLITAEEAEAAKKVDYDPSVSKTSNNQYLTYIDYVVDEAQAVTGLSEEELRSGGYTIKTAIDTKAQKAMEDAFNNDKMFEQSKDEVKMQGAMVIMNQHDGTLVAMVGGRDYAKSGWNRVTKQRQPGSSFKPIVAYGAAIETGNYFPWSTLRDDKTCYNNGKYCPGNDDGKYKGPIPMTLAIKESRNQAAVWLLNEIGVKTGINFAAKLGIKLDSEDRNLAIALGGLTHGVSPLQMARAYGAFANGGILEDPHSVLSITNAKGKVVYEYSAPKAQRVMAPETAYYVTEIMKGVTQTGGTGVRARISGRTVAGKTGTTQHGIPGLKSSANRDVWFVGYTPELTAAVWMGYDSTDKNHLVKKSSGQAAAMFSAVMSKALEGKKKQSFPKPEGVADRQPVAGVTALSGAYDPTSVSIHLEWTAENATDKTVYRVYRKGPSDGAFAKLAEAADPAFDDMAILPDQTYTYYVTAFDPDTNQESEPSGQVSVLVDSALNTPVVPPVDPNAPLPGEPGAGDGGTDVGGVGDGMGNGGAGNGGIGDGGFDNGGVNNGGTENGGQTGDQTGGGANSPPPSLGTESSPNPSTGEPSSPVTSSSPNR